MSHGVRSLWGGQLVSGMASCLSQLCRGPLLYLSVFKFQTPVIKDRILAETTQSWEELAHRHVDVLSAREWFTWSHCRQVIVLFLELIHNLICMRFGDRLVVWRTILLEWREFIPRIIWNKFCRSQQNAPTVGILPRTVAPAAGWSGTVGGNAKSSSGRSTKGFVECQIQRGSCGWISGWKFSGVMRVKRGRIIFPGSALKWNQSKSLYLLSILYSSTFLLDLESGIRERNYWLHLPFRKHVEFLLLKMKWALYMIWASKMSKIRLLPVMRFGDPTGMVGRERDIPSAKNFKGSIITSSLSTRPLGLLDRPTTKISKLT